MGRKKEIKKVYQLLLGSHMEDSIEYTAGINDQVISTKPLDELFMNKFKCLGDEDTVKIDGFDSADYDREVTADYSTPENVRVFRKGSWFYVISDEEITNNGKGLQKEAVQGFISALEEDDAAE